TVPIGFSILPRIDSAGIVPALTIERFAPVACSTQRQRSERVSVSYSREANLGTSGCERRSSIALGLSAHRNDDGRRAAVEPVRHDQAVLERAVTRASAQRQGRQRVIVILQSLCRRNLTHPSRLDQSNGLK